MLNDDFSSEYIKYFKIDDEYFLEKFLKLDNLKKQKEITKNPILSKHLPNNIVEIYNNDGIRTFKDLKAFIIHFKEPTFALLNLKVKAIIKSIDTDVINFKKDILENKNKIFKVNIGGIERSISLQTLYPEYFNVGNYYPLIENENNISDIKKYYKHFDKLNLSIISIIYRKFGLEGLDGDQFIKILYSSSEAAKNICNKESNNMQNALNKVLETVSECRQRDIIIHNTQDNLDFSDVIQDMTTSSLCTLIDKMKKRPEFVSKYKDLISRQLFLGKISNSRGHKKAMTIFYQYYEGK